MPQHNQNIFISRIRISPSQVELFSEWQAKLQKAIAEAPGFISLEILAPSSIQPLWVFIQRFSSPSFAEAWKQSGQRKKLFDEWSSLHAQHFEEDSSEEKDFEGITEVIVTEIAPEKKALYQQWLAKIQHAEAKFPGFRRMYVQTPLEDNGRYSITFLQFDSVEQLDKWLASTERRELLQELNPLIKSYETHRVISPYAGWFGSIAKTGTVPAVWKQTMLVLLVLFPIVMLEFKFLNPHLKNLDISLSTFIGNAISVSLLSWPMMPLSIFLFRWWIAQNSSKTNLLGALIVLTLYLLEIILFWNFL